MATFDDVVTSREAYETRYEARWAEKVAAGASPTGSTSQVAITDVLTLDLSHAGKTISLTAAADKAITVPLNSSVAFPIGTKIKFIQLGAGQVVITPVSGSVTINALTGLYSSAANAVLELEKVATNTWHLSGNTAAS